MDRDIQYENSNIGFDEQYPEEDGGGIKCKNYKFGFIRRRRKLAMLKMW